MEDVARGYVHLAWTGLRNRDHAIADAALAAGLDYCAAPRLDLWRLYLQGLQSRSQLDQGHWTEAAETASVVLGDARTSSIPRIHAGVVLALVRARRGDPGSSEPLDGALALSRARRGAPVRRGGRRGAGGGRLAARRSRRRGAGDRGRLRNWRRELGAGGVVGELALWRRRAGVSEQIAATSPSPMRCSSRATGRRRRPSGRRSGARTRRRWRWPTATAPPATARWTSCTSSAPARRRPSSPAACVPAAPAGLRRGPRRTTRDNPANLTPREVEVLALRRAGAAQPADRRAALRLGQDGRSPRRRDPAQARRPHARRGGRGGPAARPRARRRLSGCTTAPPAAISHTRSDDPTPAPRRSRRHRGARRLRSASARSRRAPSCRASASRCRWST